MEKYYLIGIKGAGMSALAHILFDMGYSVSGSDIADMLFTQVELEAKGMTFDVFGQAQIEPNMQVIIGNAFDDDHPDVKQAKMIGARLVRYHDFLGMLADQFTSIAISGTHGKTTTTGMMAHVLRLMNPTAYLIGDGTGKGMKDSDYFVFEACEYKRHFHAYRPDYLIITNIEHDHPDYFKDLADVQLAFYDAAAACKKQLIACGDDQGSLSMKKHYPSCLIYGLNDHNDVKARNVIKSEAGTTFDVIIHDRYFGTFDTPFFGNHMVLNSLAIITVCFLEGKEATEVASNLAHFDGVKRRFNITEWGEQVIIDDYAHHPTEITVTLQAVRQKYPTREIIAIFQPHTFTRTHAFLSEFSEALALADVTYLTDIFGSAREASDMMDISMLLAENRLFKHVTFDNIVELKNYPSAVLVFMGAGDIEKYEQAYKQLK